MYIGSKIGAQVSRLLQRRSELTPHLANDRPRGNGIVAVLNQRRQRANSHGEECRVKITQLPSRRTYRRMAARDDDPITDLTFAELLEMMNAAIEDNANLQTRENALRTAAARDITRLRVEIEDRPDTSEAQASTLMPPKFTGDGDYSARAFLRKFDRYAIFKRWDDAARFRCIPLFLDRSAEIWYDRLLPQPTDYAQFRQALLQTFETHVTTFVDEQTFARIAQKPHEPVTRYYARLIEAAEKHNINPAAQLNHFLGSLQPPLKTQVITHGPRTLEEALEKARLAEQALINPPPAIDPRTVAAQMTTMKQKLVEKDREIQAQNKRHAAQLEAQASNFNAYRPSRSPQRQYRNTPPRSPSPYYAKVHFPNPPHKYQKPQSRIVNRADTTCTFCHIPGHTASVCRKKIRAEKAMKREFSLE